MHVFLPFDGSTLFDVPESRLGGLVPLFDLQKQTKRVKPENKTGIQFLPSSPCSRFPSNLGVRSLNMCYKTQREIRERKPRRFVSPRRRRISRQQTGSMNQNPSSCAWVVALLATMQGIRGLEYAVTNLAEREKGGQLFDEKIGEAKAIEMMKAATTDLETRVFQTGHLSERKEVDTIRLVIKQMETISDHEERGKHHQISISARYIENSNPERLEAEVKYLVYHEMAHVWQWTGNGGAPPTLRNGIGYYAVFFLLGRPTRETQVGRGDPWSWKKSSRVISQFLFYCAERKSDFVAKLNRKMVTTYNDRFFKDLLDQPIDRLWENYKAKYGKD